jgi:cell division protein FtsZ
MREFNEIGDVVHQFASEDATVVIGTALDPELQDEVRVTVVATGLNRNAARQVMRREQPAVVERPRIIARTGTDDLPVDYLKPAPATPAARAVAEPAKAKETQSDWLDIPAFLRKQAD